VEPVGRISASASAKSIGQKEAEQKEGEQCAAAVDVQPTTSKSDRLLDFIIIPATGVAFWRNPMEVLYILIPLAMVVVALAVWAFVWSVRSGQFEDLEGPAWRILMDDDDPKIPEDARPKPKEPL
jgi:cbb3-type cytochrome oxidase maturation protein